MNLIEFKQKNAGVSVKPILFSTEMVKAILQSRKTQTRRALKPQPELPENPIEEKTPFGFVIRKQIETNPDRFEVVQYWKCPYGKPGDILWVRETFAKLINGHNELFYTYYEEDPNQGDYIENWQGWKPSIHMPFEAARIFLRIKSVRVERLLDISEVDAIEEGVESVHIGESIMYKNYYDSNIKQYSKAFSSFISLWLYINGEESCRSNPWVWVVEFERIDINK